MILFLCPFVWLSSGRLSTKKLLYIIFVREKLSCSSTKILLAMNFVGIILEKCPYKKMAKQSFSGLRLPKTTAKTPDYGILVE